MVNLGSYATAEEAALTVARSAEGQVLPLLKYLLVTYLPTSSTVLLPSAYYSSILDETDTSILPRARY